MSRGPGIKPTKVPYNPRQGTKASSTDPSTWSTFDDVLASGTGYDGIGFVFAADDELVGVDLDDCRNPETGSIELWAIEVLGDTRSYTEVSPSGTGLHVFLRGHLPAGARKRGPIEIYERGRYFTVTGHRVDELLADLRAPVLPMPELHAKLFPPQTVPPAARHPDVPSLDSDDVALVNRARQAANGAKFSSLWAGDTSSYPSASEADRALCSLLAFWSGRDAVRMDRLFRQSALLRPKWDERRGEETYGIRTIHQAIAQCHETYGGGAQRLHARAAASSGTGSPAAIEQVANRNGHGTDGSSVPQAPAEAVPLRVPAKGSLGSPATSRCSMPARSRARRASFASPFSRISVL